MKKLTLVRCLMLAALSFSSVAEAQSRIDWGQVWKKQLESNPLNLSADKQSELMALYRQFNFQPQFVFWEDQHKISRIAQIQDLVASHGINPNDFALKQIMNISNDSEREVRMMLEVLRIAKAVSVGRISQASIAPPLKYNNRDRNVYPKYHQRNFGNLSTVAQLIQSPSQRALDSLAPQHEDYTLLKNLLSSASANEKEKISLSLEKLRWLPPIETLSRYMIINTAATHAKTYDRSLDRSSELHSFRIITGAQNKWTPSMPTSIRNVVINPYWNVAINDTIWNTQKLPAIHDALNASGIVGVVAYLDERLYEVVSTEGETRGQVLDPALIDWALIIPGVKPGFQLRQRPNDSNALGVIKFYLEDGDDVYMHDTNQRDKFENSNRNLSSGCIRISKPYLLAEHLLKSTRWTLDSILEETTLPAFDRVEKWIKVPGQTMNVFTLQLTAQVIDGQLVTSNDVYKEDKALKDALKTAGYSILN